MQRPGDLLSGIIVSYLSACLHFLWQSREYILYDYPV